MANGTKLSVRNGNGNTGYDYDGSFVYTVTDNTPTLEAAHFAGGQLKANGVNYTLTDHLGSVRSIVDATRTIQEQNDYYPFGSRHVNAGYASNGNRYKFSGKERQDMSDLNRYDFGARMYASDIARWSTVDPLCEDYYSQSLFHYCGNNPIGFIDSFGLDYWSTSDPYQIAIFFNALQGQSDTKNWFDAFDYSSWTHVKDKDLLDNLVYNDNTGMYHFSYVTKIDGDYACVGVSIKSPRKVLPELSGWWDTLMYGLNGRTYSTTATLTGEGKEPYTVPISYKLNMKGEIIGYAPNILKVPDVGKKGFVYIKG